MIREIIRKVNAHEIPTNKEITYLEDRGWLLPFSPENPRCQIFLTQNPYLGDTCGFPVYKAAAMDFVGNEYEITWELRNGWEDMEDASDHCFWEDYSVNDLS